MTYKKEIILREEDLTAEQRQQRRDWGQAFLCALDKGIKVAEGKSPRSNQSMNELLNELDEWVANERAREANE